MACLPKEADLLMLAWMHEAFASNPPAVLAVSSYRGDSLNNQQNLLVCRMDTGLNNTLPTWQVPRDVQTSGKTMFPGTSFHLHVQMGRQGSCPESAQVTQPRPKLPHPPPWRFRR